MINTLRCCLQRLICEGLLLLRVLVLSIHHSLLEEAVDLVLLSVHGRGLVMAHHLRVLVLLPHVHIVSVGREVIGRRSRHTTDGLSILPSDLMVLHLLNNLLHVLTCLLELGELLLKPYVEGLQRDGFLRYRHTLDTSEQVVCHIVGGLENVILLEVDRSQGHVLNLID